MTRPGRILRLALFLPIAIIALGGYAIADSPGPNVVSRSIDGRPPQVDGSQKAAAALLASRHDFLRDLLKGRDYQVVSEGAWHGFDDQLLGVAQLIRFSEPQDVDARRWPQIQYNPNNDTYRPFDSLFTVTGLTEIQVLIDLRSQRVVAVNPEIYVDIIPIDVSGVPESLEVGEGEQ
jgi:hypothetical protein